MTELHKTEVKYIGVYQEYLAECVCGWVGSYLPTHSLAGNQAAKHRTEAYAS